VLKLGAVTYCEYSDIQNKSLPPGVAARPELEVKSGDVLFTRKNTYELVAACALVCQTRPRLMLSDLIFRLCIKKDAPLVPEYLWQLLIHPGQRAQIQRLAGGSSGSMPNISKQRLSTVSILLPPRALQQEFAAIVHASVNMRDRMKTNASDESNSLFDSLVQRAFKGEL
jgi:type I restriction enzyme S subunit